MPTFMMLITGFLSVLLIAVILLQRGRGGGLVGALSGLGGQSAFGTKAGDMFTRITIGIAAAWVLLLGISGQVLRARTEKFRGDEAPSIQSKSKDTGAATSAKPSETTTPPQSPEDSVTKPSGDGSPAADSPEKKNQTSTESSPKESSAPDATPQPSAEPKSSSESSNPKDDSKSQADEKLNDSK